MPYSGRQIGYWSSGNPKLLPVPDRKWLRTIDVGNLHWEDKMDLGYRSDSVDYIQDRVQWREFLIMTMNSPVMSKQGIS
jgi:hypothetical protein